VSSFAAIFAAAERYAPYGRSIIVRVVHVPFTFAPDPVGGTEIYVEALAHNLRSHGIESLVSAPSDRGTDETYEHNGMCVRRYRAAPESKYMLRELYGGGDPEAAAAFARILDEERPDAVHIHAFTRGVSVLLVRVAKQRGLPVLFTYHTPTISCQRGTLMVWGRDECDGVLSVRRCAGCSLHGHGLPRGMAILLSYVPSRLACSLEKANLSGGMWTALRMSELTRARQQAFRALMEEVDGVIAPSEWVRVLLMRNGVPDWKITLSRHGLPGARHTLEKLIDVAKTPLRVAFLGRADVMKGADTLIKAVRAAPGLSIELHLYGVTQSTADEDYWAALKSLAGQDSRIAFLASVSHDEVVSLLSGYHVLAVPSRCAETGPLVVLESFAAGTPVVGSKLGGIAEWVRHRKNGLLVESENVRAWTEALCQCAEDRSLLIRLREGVELSRSMADVAREMAKLYCRYINLAQHPKIQAIQ
jgi:glycosyltransferase involved in cell wall biosynthesis